MQSAAAFRYRAGPTQLPAPDFVWTLPSVPDASGCSPSWQISEHGWAKSGGQPPVQPARHQNRGSLDKDVLLVRNVLHLHLDGCETLLARLLPPWPSAPEYGRVPTNKARRERRRACNTPGETMGRAPRPGSGDRLPAANQSNVPFCQISLARE